MIIRCPNCGRSGNLPDAQVLTPHILRCRTCQSRFVLGAVPLDETETALVTAQASQASSPALGAIERTAADQLFSAVGDEHEDHEATSADSHYGLPGLDHDDEDIPDHDEWATDEVPTRAFDRPASNRQASAPAPLADPWYYKFIHAWGRVHFFGAIGFTLLSMLVIGCLVLARLTGNLKPESSALIIVVGIVAAIALLMISLSTTALNLLLIDLARNIHKLRIQSEPDSRDAR